MQFLRGAAFVCVALLIVLCCGEHAGYNVEPEESFEEAEASVDMQVATSYDSGTGKSTILKPFAKGTKNAKSFEAPKHVAKISAKKAKKKIRTGGPKKNTKRGSKKEYISSDAWTGPKKRYHLGNNRRRIGAGFGRRRRSAPAHCVTFKTWRHFARHKMIAAALSKLPKNPCNKKELAHKAVMHNKENAAKRAVREKHKKKMKELRQKHHLHAVHQHKKISDKCKLTHGRHAKAVRAMKRALQKVAAAKAAAKKLCEAQKRANERAKKEKKLLRVNGPTFTFKPSKPCKGGLGTFTKPLIKDARVNVGVIPSGMANVKIELKTDKDLDAEVWTKDSKTAIVAWKCVLHNTKHGKRSTKVKDACIDSANKITKQWDGNMLRYSGWLGKEGPIGRKFGHEVIEVLGRNNMPFMMRAFAYEAGTARVKYSWGVNRAKCEAHKAMLHKERKAKFDAKRAAKKALKEKDYKAVLKVLYASVQFCSSARRMTKQARQEYLQSQAVCSNLNKVLAACKLRTHQARDHVAVTCLEHKCPAAVRNCKQNRRCNSMIKCLNACPSKPRSVTHKCVYGCMMPHAKHNTVKRLGWCGHQAKCWSTKKHKDFYSKERAEKAKKHVKPIAKARRL